MSGQRRRKRTPEDESRFRRLQTIAVGVILLVTLVLVYKAMTTV